jgi:ribose transport system substrate-binding protein
MRRLALACLLIVGLVGTLVATGCTDQPAGVAHPTPNQPFRVALSMSYIGNDWQVESRKMVEAEAKTPPYNKQVKLDTYVAGASANAGGPDVERQIEQIQQMIAKGYNAIVAFPISSKALNPVVKQACDHGIIVVAYDSEITEPCAYNVHINQFKAGQITGKWLADRLHGRGNIVTLTGVPGTSVDTQRNQGLQTVLSQNPGMKVISSFPGLWDQAATQQGMARILSAYQNIDGVWAQVGYGALQAFQQAKRRPVPMVGESENGFRSAMASGAVDGISYGSPAYTGAYALKEAVALLQGNKQIPKLMQVPLPLNTRDSLKQCSDAASGCNVFPPSQVPSAGFFSDFYDSRLVPEMCLQAATSAKPCPGQTAAPPIPTSFPPDATSGT